jgi:hypothetical protein
MTGIFIGMSSGTIGYVSHADNYMDTPCMASEALDAFLTLSSQKWYFQASSLACWSPSSFPLSSRLLL